MNPVNQRLRKDKQLCRKFFCVIAILIIFPYVSFAQGEISLSVENVDLKTLLVEIEKKSDIRFTYLNQLSDTNKDISLAVTNKTVEEILNLVLSKKGMEFTRTGNTIAIQMRSPQNRQTAPTKKVTGIVTDSNGEPIIGANVSVSGTGIGTITDVDGNFKLGVDRNATLTISFIGYKKVEIKAAPILNLSLIHI